MPVYEWQRAKPLTVRGGRVAEGETVRAPEEVGRAFGDLLEEQDDTGQEVDREVSFNGPDDDGDAGDGDAEGDTQDAEELDGDPAEEVPPDEVDDDAQDLLDGTVEEVQEAIESGDWDDRLGELEAAEARGDGRVTVQNAIRARRRAQGGGE